MIGGPGWHALVAGAVGIVAVAAGGWSRTAGPLVTGTAILVTLTVHESLGTLAGVPTWAWLAAGGTILLAAGIALERTDTSPSKPAAASSTSSPRTSRDRPASRSRTRATAPKEHRPAGRAPARPTRRRNRDRRPKGVQAFDRLRPPTVYTHRDAATGGFVAACACLAMVAGACSKGGDKGAAGRATTTTEVPVAIAFTITSFDVEAAADPVEGAVDGAQAGIEATLKRVAGRGRPPAPPLGRSRRATSRPSSPPPPGNGWPPRPTGPRSSSDGLPPVSGLKAETATLAVVGLADPDGQIPIVTVHLDLTLRGTAEGTPLTVEHTGDLVLVPEGDGWKIDGYDVRATRDTAGATTTTTASREGAPPLRRKARTPAWSSC